jgi:NAD(P)-dependent dehydrogenase (short-subunit alcohol dehydrogenase family)
MPVIPATFPEERVDQFGKDTPMKRPRQPHEVGICNLFVASDDASYISGLFLHLNGGQIVGG